MCPICLLDNIVESYILKCEHIFCKKCIDEWMKISNICPLCRQILCIITIEYTISESPYYDMLFPIICYENRKKIKISYEF